MIHIGGNNCDIKIFTDNIEEEALSTLYRMAESKAYRNKKIRIMPDVHQGKGCVIGFSCPIDIENDFISPEVVGCDLGCTVSAIFFDKAVPEEKIAELEHKIRKTIPFGKNVNDKSKVDEKLIIRRFNEAQNKLCSHYPIFSDYRINFRNDADLKNWVDKFHMDYGLFMKSIGSVGSGNHYLEYDVSDDKYCICVHCGSRNLGLKVFNYWNKIANSMTISKDEKRMIIEIAKSKNTDKNKLNSEIKAAREEYLSKRIPRYLGGKHLMGYLVDVLLAQEYSRLNHEVILTEVSEIYSKCCPNGAKVVDEIFTTHNYVDYDLNSSTSHPMIRKGAIRAYVGERVIIPFNMKDGISICEGKSNEDWNYTAPHGCGRLYSRSKAKQIFNANDFKAEMQSAGVYTTTADSTTVDECPSSYKPRDEIVSLIEPTVKVLFYMHPRMNIKASECF